jgi:hypothetical protein
MLIPLLALSSVTAGERLKIGFDAVIAEDTYIAMSVKNHSSTCSTSGDRISTVRRHLIRSWLFNVGRQDDNILPIMPSDCKVNLHEYRMHGCDENAVASWAN